MGVLEWFHWVEKLGETKQCWTGEVSRALENEK